MIEYIEGDIFSSPAQVIVNPVNTVGVMGKGLALAFKQRYPEMFAHLKPLPINIYIYLLDIKSDMVTEHKTQEETTGQLNCIQKSN